MATVLKTELSSPVVRTARPERLSLDGNWRVNGVGRNVSHSFGYGLLDAAGMVRLARSWRTVPPQRRCELAAPRPQRPVPPKSSVVLQVKTETMFSLALLLLSMLCIISTTVTVKKHQPH